MSNLNTFESFTKIPRLFRTVTISEKIDGTNAQICITPEGEMLIGSRNRWITPENDNYGFARWCMEHKEQLMRLGVGRHYGEWYGAGIQRGYGLSEKRLALFNSNYWGNGVLEQRGITCCGTVPMLWHGALDAYTLDRCIHRLIVDGSLAVPGWKQPEGLIMFHSQSKQMYKWTLDGDGHKGT